jgi:hypothetical protein
MASPDVRSHEPIYVVATTPEGTREAMTAARQLSHDHGGHPEIVLLIPRSAPLISGSDSAPAARASLIDPYLSLAVGEGANAVVFCVCQRADDAVHVQVSRSARVVIAGRPGGAERRLANRLQAAGYQVVFAPVSTSGSARSPRRRKPSHRSSSSDGASGRNRTV